MHLVFLPHNIVGADFNFFGPRVSALEFYLRNKSGPSLKGRPKLRISPLFRNDVRQELKKLSEVSLFRFRMKAPAVEALKDVDKSLAAAFESQMKISNAGEFEIVLKKSRAKNADGLKGIADYAKKILGKQDIAANTTALKVSGYSTRFGRIDEVDLLKDQLVSKKAILRQDAKSRALKEASAFDAITTSFEELENELVNAHTLDEKED